MLQYVETNRIIDLIVLVMIATDLWVFGKRAKLFIAGFIEGLKDGE